ncbi:unnamed protein product [Pleuronectes platessa]|uniref:Uncharacterized protein n=1 Tax=Pleuronectes platessa TaxID=8262 RepID=A0A9N7V2T9_PLEPL|nr:unnamed protein product [Pleuronectes platessa]
MDRQRCSQCRGATGTPRANDHPALSLSAPFSVVAVLLMKKHSTKLNPLPHLELHIIKKIAKKNDLSPRLVMRLRGTFISIVGVCSPTVCRSFMFEVGGGAAQSSDTGLPQSSEVH